MKVGWPGAAYVFSGGPRRDRTPVTATGVRGSKHLGSDRYNPYVIDAQPRTEQALSKSHDSAWHRRKSKGRILGLFHMLRRHRASLQHQKTVAGRSTRWRLAGVEVAPSRKTFAKSSLLTKIRAWLLLRRPLGAPMSPRVEVQGARRLSGLGMSILTSTS